MARRQIGVTIESMTGSPHGVTPGGSWPPPSGPPPTWPPTPPKQSRVPVIASLIIAIVAVAVATAAWFRPAGEITASPEAHIPKFSAEEISSAKDSVCEAHEKVSRATEAAGGETSDDQLTKFAIALGIRVTATLSADYIFRKLEENPATPPDLANDLRDLASAYQELLLSQIGNATTEELDLIYQQIDDLDPAIVEACK